MKPLVCKCMEEYTDPRNVCDTCGYPMCQVAGCSNTPGCNHDFASQDALPVQLRKRLRLAHSARSIEYHVALIQCFECQQAYCENCYNEYAIRYVGYEWTPQTAFKYAQPILDAAMGLYLVNKRLRYDEKLPKAILIKIVGYL